jgi:NTP pyrophosphatase (non-canonical NTP hydrolase)
MSEIEIELTPEQEFRFAAVKMHVDKVPREEGRHDSLQHFEEGVEIMALLANGLNKLMEESGELIQAAAKTQANLGNKIHDPHQLRQSLHDEIGDTLAAIDYVISELELDRSKIEFRATEKRQLFESWKDLL